MTTTLQVKRELDTITTATSDGEEERDSKRPKLEGGASEVLDTSSVTAHEIKYDLSIILSPLPTENRAFAYYLPCFSLKNVPMPGLEIAGIGGVGLPLSDRDSLLIKRLAETRAKAADLDIVVS